MPILAFPSSMATIRMTVGVVLHAKYVHWGVHVGFEGVVGDAPRLSKGWARAGLMLSR